MGLRSSLARPFAAFVASKTKKWSLDPFRYQQNIMQEIVGAAKPTAFGKDHDFAAIRSYDDFKKRVPIRDYEGLKSYFDRIVKGEPDVMWNGKPKYLAKTSGTTLGTKYIPISKQSLPNHFRSARNAVLSYVHETGNASFLDGGLIFLSGSPELEIKNGIKKIDFTVTEINLLLLMLMETSIGIRMVFDIILEEPGTSPKMSQDQK